MHMSFKNYQLLSRMLPPRARFFTVSPDGKAPCSRQGTSPQLTRRLPLPSSFNPSYPSQNSPFLEVHATLPQFCLLTQPSLPLPKLPPDDCIHKYSYKQHRIPREDFALLCTSHLASNGLQVNQPPITHNPYTPPPPKIKAPLPLPSAHAKATCHGVQYAGSQSYPAEPTPRIQYAKLPHGASPISQLEYRGSDCRSL